MRIGRCGLGTAAINIPSYVMRIRSSLRALRIPARQTFHPPWSAFHALICNPQPRCPVSKVTKLKPRQARRRARYPDRSRRRGRRRPFPRRSTACWPTASRSISRPRISTGTSAGRISATTTCCSTNRPPRSSRPPTTWPSASARSAARRSARSATSPSCRRIEDNDADFVPPAEMLRELMNDNKKVAAAHAQGARGLRRARGRRHREPDRELASTRPRSGPGSCSRRRAAPATTGTDRLARQAIRARPIPVGRALLLSRPAGRLC